MTPWVTQSDAGAVVSLLIPTEPATTTDVGDLSHALIASDVCGAWHAWCVALTVFRKLRT